MLSTEASVQTNVQETPHEAPQGYTAEQYSSMQSKLRKESQELKDKLSRMETELLTVRSANDELETKKIVLEQTVADQYGQLTEGISDDVKIHLTENQKLKIAKMEAETRARMKAQALESELTQYKESEKKQLIDNMVSKFGFDRDHLEGVKDVRELNNLLNNLDIAKLKPPEAPEVTVLPKPSSPQIQPQGSGADRKFSQDDVAGMARETYAANREQILRQFREGSLK